MPAEINALTRTLLSRTTRAHRVRFLVDEIAQHFLIEIGVAPLHLAHGLIEEMPTDGFVHDPGQIVILTTRACEIRANRTIGRVRDREIPTCHRVCAINVRTPPYVTPGENADKSGAGVTRDRPVRYG